MGSYSKSKHGQVDLDLLGCSRPERNRLGQDGSESVQLDISSSWKPAGRGWPCWFLHSMHSTAHPEYILRTYMLVWSLILCVLAIFSISKVLPRQQILEGFIMMPPETKTCVNTHRTDDRHMQLFL